MIAERLSTVLLASLITRGISLVVPLFVTPLLLENIGISNYAIIGIFVFIQSTVVLLDFGIVPTLVREMSILSARYASDMVLRDTLRTIEFVYAGLAFCVLLFGGLVGMLTAFFWMDLETMEPQRVALIFLVMSLGVSASFMNSLYSGTMAARGRQLRLNIISIIFSLLGASASIYGLVYWNWNLLEFVACQACISWISLAITRRFAWRSMPLASARPSFDKSILLSLRRFAAGMSITQLLAVISMNFDRIMLARLLPAESFGHYALASSAASSISGVAHPITSAVTPKLMFAFGSENRQGAVDQYHLYTQLVSVVIFPVVLTAVFFAEPLFIAWLNDTRIASVASFPFQLLALGWLLNVLMNIPYVAQLAHGWVRLGLFALLASLVIQMPVLVYFVPRYGIDAGAWSWLIMELGFFFVAIPIMHCFILRGEALEWYCRDILRPGMGAAVVAILSYFLFNNLNYNDSFDRIGVIMYVIATVMLSMASSALFGGRILSYFKTVIGHRS